MTCLVVVLAATVAGVATFALGARRLTRTIRVGRPAPGRLRPVGRRAWLVVREMAGHGRFQHTAVGAAAARAPGAVGVADRGDRLAVARRDPRADRGAGAPDAAGAAGDARPGRR